MAHCSLALHQLYGDVDQALSSARRAVELVRTSGLLAEKSLATSRLILVLLYQGLLASEGGFSLLEEAEEAAAQAGDLLLRFSLRLNRGVWYLDTADLDAAEVALEMARTVLGEAAPSSGTALLNVNLGELRLMTGEISRATESFVKVLSQKAASVPASVTMIATAGLGLCELHEGKLRKARARSDSVSLRGNWSFDPTLPVTFLAKIHMRRGDVHAGLEVLHSTAAGVAGRWPLSWIKLGIEEVRLLRLVSQSAAASLAREVHDFSASLGLYHHCKTLEKFL